MADGLIDKKLDYSFENKNFVIEGELTVTITLSEYRDLVSIKATKETEIKKANEDRYNRESENKNLKEENAKLKAELYELKKKLDSMTESAPESVEEAEY